MAVFFQVRPQLARFLTMTGVSPDGPGQGVEAAFIQFVPTPLDPLLSALRFGAVERLAQFAEVFLGMPTVQNLGCLGILFLRQVPDPSGAVAQHHHSSGTVQTTTGGLALYALIKLRRD